MSGPDGHQHTGVTRFQIASRIGAFRDTTILSDPFGTGAKFHIRRKGSTAHRAWAKAWADNDPLTHSLMEEQVLGEPPIVLTKEEEQVVEAAREAARKGTGTPSDLLAIVDRLVSTREELNQSRAAIKRAIDAGQTTVVDVATDSQGGKRRLDEALFILSGWDNLPDAEGTPIPYNAEVARELLQNDTPIEGVGIDDLILAQEAWTIRVPRMQEPTEEQGTDLIGDAAPPENPSDISPPDPLPDFVMIRPGLTIGRAYILWAHWVAEKASLFRDQVTEAATKNSPPPSEVTTSSGGGTSSEEPASS